MAKNTQSEQKNKKSTMKILLAILALLVAWFIIWLYDWKDELLGMFRKNSSTAPKATGGSSTTGTSTTTNTGGDKIYFNTIVKEVAVGGDVRFVHQQAEASLTWYITHNLGVQPNVRITTLGGEEIYGNVRDNVEQRINPENNVPYYVVNTTVIEFSEPQSGFAIFA